MLTAIALPSCHPSWHITIRTLGIFAFFFFFNILFDWAGSWLQQVGSFSCGMPRSIIIII